MPKTSYLSIHITLTLLMLVLVFLGLAPMHAEALEIPSVGDVVTTVVETVVPPAPITPAPETPTTPDVSNPSVTPDPVVDTTPSTPSVVPAIPEPAVVEVGWGGGIVSTTITPTVSASTDIEPVKNEPIIYTPYFPENYVNPAPQEYTPVEVEQTQEIKAEVAQIEPEVVVVNESKLKTILNPSDSWNDKGINLRDPGSFFGSVKDAFFQDAYLRGGFTSSQTASLSIAAILSMILGVSMTKGKSIIELLTLAKV